LQKNNLTLLSGCQPADKSIADINKEMHRRKYNLSFTYPVMDPSLTFITQERDLGAVISHQHHAQQQCKKLTRQLCRKAPRATQVQLSPATSVLKLRLFPQFITSHATEVQHQTVARYDQSHFTSLSVYRRQLPG